ncbi:MAG: precorrin-2 C(20)-methyltransferase [Chloroflexi bacterium]|nr:precorrin-2 C(20)-methyltransferase [Chloroflexota bacterium]
MTDRRSLGRFYGVGVGPGDPELLTLRAYRVLAGVPVIFVPQKDGESASFARSIIGSAVKSPEHRVTGLIFPMTRDREKLAEHWEQAVNAIWKELESGNDCAFINVGDPLLYGTFIHVYEGLKKSHPEVDVEVIPGISSVNAAAARTVTPLASDDERIAIISATDDDNFIRETLKNFDCVVILKIHRLPDRLLDILEQMNVAEKCIYVRRCTTQDEEIVRNVSELRGSKLDYFSLLLMRR